jgi:hypothetical protein
MKKHAIMMERVYKHGEHLNEIFHTDLEPVQLAKKVHRLETIAHRLAEDYCNGLIESDDWHDIKEEKVLRSLDKLLRFTEQGIPVIMNGDPRGYALKIDDAYIREHNITIYRDFGGYGILAPEFDGE